MIFLIKAEAGSEAPHPKWFVLMISNNGWSDFFLSMKKLEKKKVRPNYLGKNNPTHIAFNPDSPLEYTYIYIPVYVSVYGWYINIKKRREKQFNSNINSRSHLLYFFLYFLVIFYSIISNVPPSCLFYKFRLPFHRITSFPSPSPPTPLKPALMLPIPDEAPVNLCSWRNSLSSPLLEEYSRGSVAFPPQLAIGVCYVLEADTIR